MGDDEEEAEAVVASLIMGFVVIPHRATANVTGEAMKMMMVCSSGERKKYLGSGGGGRWSGAAVENCENETLIRSPFHVIVLVAIAAAARGAIFDVGQRARQRVPSNAG